ncbi:MAG: dihydrodipicolinate synthase family protein [Deltaproteobacteria bacterium]|jgi:dihydrodipicolinate synthase/N-acetylneuraminate lyase
MSTTVTPRGLICPLALVPSPENRSIYRGLESLLTRLQPAVAGLFLDPMFWCPDAHCSGPASSSLLEEAIGLAPPDLPLWIRITGTSAEQTIHICHQLENVCRRLKYHGPLAWVDTPLFYHSNRGLPEYYRTLLAETGFNLIIDNDPQLIRKIGDTAKRKNIRTAILKKLVQEPRLVALVHRGDLRRGINYQRAVRSRSDFLIYDGRESSFLKRPSASGVLSVGANLLPYEWRTITLASLNLEENHFGQASSFRHLWEAGQRVRTLQKNYRQSPVRIIPAVLAAWGLIPEKIEGLTSEEEKAREMILEHLPKP